MQYEHIYEEIESDMPHTTQTHTFSLLSLALFDINLRQFSYSLTNKKI